MWWWLRQEAKRKRVGQHRTRREALLHDLRAELDEEAACQQVIVALTAAFKNMSLSSQGTWEVEMDKKERAQLNRNQVKNTARHKNTAR